MFGTLGAPELFLIFAVALIVFGPNKLPQLGKSLGQMMVEFRKASRELQTTLESEVAAESRSERREGALPSADAAVAHEVETPATPAPSPQEIS